ncbi:MAG: mobilization protein [Desulfobacteraceae bacterium]|nr:mobilization protein [Desulfobacteraceae bacterium]
MTEIKSKKLDDIEKRINELKARKSAEEARLKRKVKKDDTRKKILIGAYFMDQAEKNGNMADLIEKLDPFLTRKNDRELFGLPVLDEQK